MPISYLDVPEGLAAEGKQEMVKRMYEALHEAYPFPDDVRIFIREWPAGSVSQDGQLGAEPIRPVFMMHVPQGGDLDARRTMVRRISTAISAAYHAPKLMIFLTEYPLDQVALDGKLHADNRQRVEDQKKVYGV
jgi:phenylpyruvate tautomerase PptA (4-oxalocrotonate tautomerase family)